MLSFKGNSLQTLMGELEQMNAHSAEGRVDEKSKVMLQDLSDQKVGLHQLPGFNSMIKMLLIIDCIHKATLPVKTSLKSEITSRNDHLLATAETRKTRLQFALNRLHRLSSLCQCDACFLYRKLRAQNTFKSSPLHKCHMQMRIL